MAKNSEDNGNSFQNPGDGRGEPCDDKGGMAAKGGMAGGMKPSSPMQHPVAPITRFGKRS